MFQFIAPYAIAGGAIIAAIVAAFFKGRKAKATETKLDAAQAELETRARIDAAEIVTDADLARKRLHKRGQSGGNL